MKKFFAFLFTLVLCFSTCMAVAACEKIEIEEISIVAPASTSIKAGETFALEFTTVPEEAAEKIKVKWEISDETKLSYKDGEFTALTCGNVKVKANVKGNEATDEIELKVTAPEGFKEYSSTGYRLVYPSKWTASKQGKLQTWTSSKETTNMNVSTEELNTSYFTAPASSFQSVIESTYGLMNITVNFKQPVTVKKDKYLGIERVRVDYLYTLTAAGTMMTIHQTQMIINNADADLSCILTVTFQERDFNEAAEELQDTIFSQFMPA